jgi:hypothetical protein
MATLKRAVVKIDGTEISTIEAHYVVSRAANPAGRRIGDSMRARAYFYADISDTARNTQDNVIKLWKMATETADPLHDVEIAFFMDEEEKRLQTVQFKGWISIFESFNPAVSGNGTGSAGMGGAGTGPSMTSLQQFGNVLFCELQVVLDDANISNHQLTK